jgi:hypothetical protein
VLVRFNHIARFIVNANQRIMCRAGRPSKYLPEVVDDLLAAIGDGLTLKQACTAAGISESALAAYRERHPELNPRLEQAREQAR